ncbi:hypothetical protein PF011_g33075 [Phytophthora fragariae]|uniref:RxLR effector protein n=1 Tax=Phytophthora fragariae TaxID=53985 RepID=A0A6A3G2Y2_9STRA|nr:hypothetical protein PF011_g33075 [Phytophthora fragariae]
MSPWRSPRYSAILFVVLLSPQAMLASHSGCPVPVCGSTCSKTDPLPPGPGSHENIHQIRAQIAPCWR